MNNSDSKKQAVARAAIDFVEYDDDLPWPLDADGEGPTLELKNPSLDNLLPQNWMASEGNGTPGLINSTYHQ